MLVSDVIFLVSNFETATFMDLNIFDIFEPIGFLFITQSCNHLRTSTPILPNFNYVSLSHA